jgi:hypothetical protein
MNRVLTALLLMIAGMSPVLAATQANGYIVPAYVEMHTNNITWVYFPLTSRAGTPPSCAANIGGSNFRYALDVSTTAGRNQLSFLLAAVASGIGVYFAGSGACTVDSSTEDLTTVGMPGQ